MAFNLEDLKNFIVVCETKNITRASEIIGISQPTLSYSIKRLESVLNGEVLIRLKNGVALTKLGEELQFRASRLLHEWKETQNLTDSEGGLIKRSYSFGAHPSVALYTLNLFLPEIQQKYPRLDIKLSHGLSREMTEKVISWEVDFGIVINPVNHPDLVLIKLVEDIVTVFHTKDSANKLIYDHNLTQSHSVLEKLKHHTFDSTIDSGNLEVIANLAAHGLGYGLLPSRVAKQYTNLQKLKNAPEFKDELFLVYRPEKHNNKISKEIISTIRSTKY